MVVFTSISIAKAGSSSQSPIFTPFNSTGGGCSTQANTYFDRTRSQGASSDPGEGCLARRLSGRQLYVWHAVDAKARSLDILVEPRGEGMRTRGTSIWCIAAARTPLTTGTAGPRRV